MERASAIQAILNKNSFTTLQNTSSNTKEGLLWKEITSGKPYIDTEMTADAKLRKADTYTEIFDGATDNEHPCRGSGMTFFRCLQQNAKSPQMSAACDEAFAAFDVCRTETKHRQSEILTASLKQQEAEDARAKSLFERRAKLLHSVASK